MLVDDHDPQEGKRLRILDENGQVEGDLEPELDGDTLVRAYRNMLLTRAADQKALKQQRQGKLGAYPPSMGQEASQLGPAMALEERDWLVWAFREMGALIWKGVPLWRQYLYWKGNEEGNSYPEGVRVTPCAVPVGSHLPHAVGIAYASMLREGDSVTLAYFGDGGSSEGDFHEALNMAGVMKAPVVFVCQNNQYAISLKWTHQTAASTIAQKAVAYGFPGIQVDGNDLLALYAATREAVDRARKGGGPTLIESYTYRLGDHTTSDDASRYRSEGEEKEWRSLDPIPRLRRYLEAKGLWDKEKEEKAMEEIDQEVNEAIQKADDFGQPSLEDLFSHTYGEMPPELRRQMEHLHDLWGGER
ncbi:MAG: pyruvate dehydrogenase (acetyl-transferring) E1 component subunit alpha [Methanomassiliicoccales archaeon]